MLTFAVQTIKRIITTGDNYVLLEKYGSGK